MLPRLLSKGRQLIQSQIRVGYRVFSTITSTNWNLSAV